MADQQPVFNMVGEKVALGPFHRDLIPTFQRWSNDFSTMRTMGTVTPRPATLEGETGWYDAVARSEQDASFVVYELGSLRLVGNTGLLGLDFRNRSAFFVIRIGEADCRGKGYGTEATRLTLDYAFTALGLHSVNLTVAEFNVGGIRAYTKAGFHECGRQRQCCLMGGKLWDVIHMDCLATEFESPVLSRVFTPDPPRS